MSLGSASRAAVVACAASIYLSALFSTDALGAPQTAGARSIWTGTFTARQADRGLQAYDRACSKCHQSDLQGSQEAEAPALVGDTFMSQWKGQPIRDLLDKVRTKMPADKPGSLTANAYLDIVAYLLQSNRFPAGGDELDLRAESLAPIISDRDR